MGVILHVRREFSFIRFRAGLIIVNPARLSCPLPQD